MDSFSGPESDLESTISTAYGMARCVMPTVGIHCQDLPDCCAVLLLRTLQPRPCTCNLPLATCFRSMWSFGSVTTTTQQLTTMILGPYTTVKECGYHAATLRGYGNGVMIEHMRFQVDHVALPLNYSVVSYEGVPTSVLPKGSTNYT